MERLIAGQSGEEVGDFAHGPGPPGQVAAGGFERRVSGGGGRSAGGLHHSADIHCTTGIGQE
jgi:hypothetical protein